MPCCYTSKSINPPSCILQEIKEIILKNNEAWRKLLLLKIIENIQHKTSFFFFFNSTKVSFYFVWMWICLSCCVQEPKVRENESLDGNCWVVRCLSPQASGVFQIAVLVKAILFSKRLAEAYQRCVFTGRYKQVLASLWRSGQKLCLSQAVWPCEEEEARPSLWLTILAQNWPMCKQLWACKRWQ